MNVDKLTDDINLSTLNKDPTQNEEEEIYGDSDYDSVPPPPEDNDELDDVDIDELDDADNDELDDVDIDELDDVDNIDNNELISPIPESNIIGTDLINELSDDEEPDENYLQKIDEVLHNNLLQSYHPDLLQHNYEEVKSLTKVSRNKDGIIIDPLHLTVPFITRYERAKILGERASQLDTGAQPMVKVDPNVIDSYLIALKEYEEKKIPFIVKRPLPNGGCEYWKLQDIEII